MSIITWIVFGLITGLTASLLDPAHDSSDVVGSVVLGILGAVLGGLMASLVFGLEISSFNLQSFIIAVFGSLFILFLTRIVRQPESETEGKDQT